MPCSVCSLEYVGGYEIGYRLQASGEPSQLQRVALEVTGVPDGQPSQPRNAAPYCVTRTGTPGEIVPAGPELQFEGDGAYGAKVSVGPSAGGATGCRPGRRRRARSPSSPARPRRSSARR